MYNVVINITITQRPNGEYPNRNKVIRVPYCTSYEVDSSWQDFTDSGTITLPRNVFYRDENGVVQTLKGAKVNIGGYLGVPLFMRGDKIKLESGYTYIKDGKQLTEQATIIDGYISRVYSTTPIRFDVEDEFFLFKQTPVPNRTFTPSETLEDMLKFLCDNVNKVHGTSFTYKQLNKTNIGQFMVYNETAAQVLARIKSTYGLVTYLRSGVLHCGVTIQYPDEVQTGYFIMNGKQGNIPADGQDLEYTRKDDILLGAIAHNTITEETGEQTKDGKNKTRKKRVEVFVTFRNGNVVSKVLESGEQVPEITDGERREFYFPMAQSADELIQLATEELKKYYYNGLRGSFDTFGIPFMRHGDIAVLSNPEMIEQDGNYRIKKVTYSGGVDGLRQTLKLDYRLNG